MIKHFLRKYGTSIIAVTLLLVMFGSGFFCAWRIQAKKAQVKHEQYTKIAKDIIILLDHWEGRVKKLEKELSKYETEISRQLGWNEEVE